MTCLGQRALALVLLGCLVELLRVTEVSIHTAHRQQLLLDGAPPVGELVVHHLPDLEETRLVIGLHLPHPQGVIVNLLIRHHPLVAVLVVEVDATLGPDAGTFLGLGPIEPSRLGIACTIVGEEVNRIRRLLGDRAPDHLTHGSAHGTHPPVVDLLPHQPLGLVVEAVDEFLTRQVPIHLGLAVHGVQALVGRLGELIADTDVGTPLRNVVPIAPQDLTDQIPAELRRTVVLQNLTVHGVDRPATDRNQPPPPGPLDVEVELRRSPVRGSGVVILDLTKGLLGDQIPVDLDRVGTVLGGRVSRDLVSGLAQWGGLVTDLQLQALLRLVECVHVDAGQLLLDGRVAALLLDPLTHLGIGTVQRLHAVVHDEPGGPHPIHQTAELFVDQLLHAHAVDKGLGPVVAHVHDGHDFLFEGLTLVVVVRHLLDVLLLLQLQDRTRDPDLTLVAVLRDDLRIVVDHGENENSNTQPVGKHNSS